MSSYKKSINDKQSNEWDWKIAVSASDYERWSDHSDYSQNAPVHFCKGPVSEIILFAFQRTKRKTCTSL